MNKIFICGNLTADPILNEREYTVPETGEIIKTKVCNFTVAANDGYGQRKSTAYFKVSVWRKRAEACAEYLSKGRGVLVNGPVKLNNYVDKNGNIRSAMEIRADDIQFLSGAKNDLIVTAEMPEEEFEDLPY